jgi:hypothetical protein
VRVGLFHEADFPFRIHFCDFGNYVAPCRRWAAFYQRSVLIQIGTPPDAIPVAILVKEPKVHWNYFLALETDVVRLARFIEFREDNFSTYSIEIARLIMAAAAEVDVVAKLVCRKLAPERRVEKINGYASVILQAPKPKLPGLTILIPRYGLTLKPWISWTPNTPPLWWTAYNKVKHHRDTGFKQANLGNALNAVSALFSLTIYHYALQFQYYPRSDGTKRKWENALATDRGRQLLLARLQPQAQLFQLRTLLEDIADAAAAMIAQC